MRILIVNGVYGYASTGSIVHDIQTLCVNQGINCYVAYSVTNLGANQLQNTYKIGSTWEKKLHALLCRINGKQAYFSYIATKLFIKYIEQINPNVVHLHTLHGNYINLPMLLSFLAENRIRTIITMHDCWYYTGGCFHYTQAGCFKWKNQCGNCPKKKADTPAFLFDKSSQILADRRRLFDAIPDLTITGVSNWICGEALKGIFKDKRVITIHNGVDVKIFKPTLFEEVEQVEDIKALQSSTKGYFVLMGLAAKWLDAINREAFLYILNQMHSDERFILFGCDDTKLLLMESINLTIKQREKIVTFGYTTNRKQLAAIYSHADVFINCTHEESFSLINVEPQACGTPVVTYANTGAEETVDNKCSFTVPTGDYKAMWIKITQIRQTGKKQYSADCIRLVRGNFNMEDNYKKYLDLYNEQFI